jgi:hypothetical protein
MLGAAPLLLAAPPLGAAPPLLVGVLYLLQLEFCFTSSFGYTRIRTNTCCPLWFRTPPLSDIKIGWLRFLFVFHLRTGIDLHDQADLASARSVTIGSWFNDCIGASSLARRSRIVRVTSHQIEVISTHRKIGYFASINNDYWIRQQHNGTSDTNLWPDVTKQHPMSTQKNRNFILFCNGLCSGGEASQTTFLPALRHHRRGPWDPNASPRDRRVGPCHHGCCSCVPPADAAAWDLTVGRGWLLPWGLRGCRRRCVGLNHGCWATTGATVGLSVATRLIDMDLRACGREEGKRSKETEQTRMGEKRG